MTRTSPIVSFGLYALNVKQDSTPSCADVQAFSKVNDLKTDNASALPYASYEDNFWLLDGGYKFLPANQATVHVGLMSESMSDAAGAFSVPPVLTVDFSTEHDSDGLTLKFSQYSGDWASSVTVDYYDDTASLIRSDTYTPTSWQLVTGVAVNGFKQIVITFSGTNKPYRYLRLTGIDYGTLIEFTGSSIRRASVVEEIDPMSGEARYNTLDLKLYSADGDFSIINPSGIYQYLQERQPIAIHETVGNLTVFIGQFYLETWENQSDTTIEFNAIDLLGVADTLPYLGGFWTGTAVETVVDGILTPLNIPYELDATLYGTLIKGWLPVCTVREALQQIAVAVGAYLDCSRSNAIKIYTAPIAAVTTPSTTITKAQKGLSQKLGLKPLVTGVELTAHNYVALSTTVTLYSGTLAAGTYTITWDDGPKHTLSASGATVASSGPNHAVLTVASPGTVSLTGRTYRDTTRTFSEYTAGLAAGTKPNVLKIANATLVNLDNGAAVCSRIYDYNQQRLVQKLRMYAPTNVQIGDVVLVDTLYDQQIRAMVERASIDLTGGMVADLELTGVVESA